MRQKVEIGLRITCCNHAPGVAKQVKTGYLLRYKKRIFGKDWREEYVVLYSDSTLAWFRDRTKGEPEGRLVIRDAPHMIAVGEWTSVIPLRPELPYGCSVSSFIAFGTKRKEKVHWFLCRDAEEVNSWMTAISNTLPPPPQPLRVQATAQLAASAPPHPAVTAATLPTVTQSAVPHPHQTAFYPSRYPYGAAAANGPLHYGPQHTTVLLRDSRSSDHGFASGMMTGALLSNCVGGWGYGPRWGAGWGWGCGIGWGGGGLERSSLHYSDTDVHINNYYDNDTTIINNDVHTALSTDVDHSCGGAAGMGASSGLASANHHHHQSYGDDELMADDDFGGGDYDGYDAGGGFDFIF